MQNRLIKSSFWGSFSGPPDERSRGYFSSRTLASRRDEVTSPPTAADQIAGIRAGLNFFERFAVDRASREETRRVAGDLIVQLLKSQREAILYKVNLELDAHKKQLFVQSLREGARIEKELAERSTEFERELIDLALDGGLSGHEQKKLRLARLDDAQASGRIDRESYETQRENIEQWARVYGENLNAKVEIILRNHAAQIERTLAVFRDNAISGHTP